MLKKAYLLSALLFSGFLSVAQTTFLSIGSQDNHVLDRLQTRSGRLSDTLCAGDKPESRRNAVWFLQSLKPKEVAGGMPAANPAMSKIDLYNAEQMISESGEWAPDENGAVDSKRSWFHTFYTKQYDFAHVKTKDFFVVVNPVLSGIGAYQQNTPTPMGLSHKMTSNSQGAELRGWIGKKIGFYTSVVDNQEKYPYFLYNSVSDHKHQYVPGADYFLPPGIATGAAGHYDYLQTSGYINFDAVKNHVNITFGSGKHFLGDGISSLFLSDNSSNTPFLQLQTRIWHINYECLYLELTPQYDKSKGDGILAHKFSTIHYLTWNTFKWLNLGFFEAEVFDRPNVYELSYLNPIIFSTAINRFNGAGDKSILGISAKILALKHVQLYGQLIFNEFRAKELFSSKKWYGNKWGIQAGAKYFDAFTLKNFDLQAELDVVRPYTYSAQDTLANYTNYNQPLADPLGSGFIKAIGVARYQPAKNLYITLKGTYYIQGVDTGGVNLGNNIFNAYVTAPSQYGVSLINGPRSHCEILNLNLSYQVRRNMFLDIGGTYRKYANDAGIYRSDYSTTGPVYSALTTNYFYIGLRINSARRDYDLF